MDRLARRRRMLLYALPALALCLALLLMFRPARQPARGSDLPTGLAIGGPAPDFTLRDLSHRSVRLSTLRGHAVLINFWATYCPPCRLEMPDLERAYRHYRSLEPRHPSATPLIVGIDAGGEDRATVASFARRVGVTYPLLLDPVFGVTLVAYHVPGIPLSVIVDAHGTFRQAHLGPLHYDEVLRALDAVR